VGYLGFGGLESQVSIPVSERPKSKLDLIFGTGIRVLIFFFKQLELGNQTNKHPFHSCSSKSTRSVK